MDASQVLSGAEASEAAQGPSLVQQLRQQVKDCRSQNALGWHDHGNPLQLSQQLSQAIDGCVKRLWAEAGLEEIALVAVGG
ncbi:MAG: hypothetical protein NWS36_04980, partial [Burkholderiaceae bacterium]|nr:hypothetical protein [Burkholderiaceae bacterium]